MNRTELHLALRPLHFLRRHSNTPGGQVSLASGERSKILLWQPETIDWIFRNDSELGHPGSRSMRPVLGPKSLLWMDGPRYAAYRKVLGPQLGSRRIGAYQRIIDNTVDRAITKLPQGKTFVLPDWTRKVTLDIASEIVLGHADQAVLSEFSTWIDRALGSPLRSLGYRVLAGGLPRSSATLDRALIAGAQATTARQPPSLVSLLLDKEGPLGNIAETELRDQIVSLLFAGHETTASATAWTVFWLYRHEELRQSVLAELASTTDSGVDPKAVPLLQATVQESLRITPPVPAAGNRVLRADTDLLGTSLSAGTVLSPSIHIAHRQPEHFPEPWRFDASRFLGKRPQSHHYFPFGGGSRHCLGSQLGQLEARVITAALLRRRSLRCVNPAAGVPEFRGHAMAPSARLRMQVIACHD
ncbi:cytochrome P450 [Saccharomonospora sp. NPDC006951]